MKLKPYGLEKLRLWLIPALLILSASSGSEAVLPAETRVAVHLNTEEADAVLAILGRKAGAVEDALWKQLFASEPYQRLKKREEEIGRRFKAPDLKFTDDDFRRFVLSPELAAQAPELERALREWKKADLQAIAGGILAYLPEDARIKAKVFPVIKPRRNSFVYDLDTDPSVFLYLDPGMTRAEFENTVAHEMHHIGFSSVEPEQKKLVASLPSKVRTAVEWIGGFGEGFAMLAAAGGPGVHPHAASSPETKARWDRDMARFDRDLEDLEKFFMDVIDGRLATQAAIEEKGTSFFGVQGPWYTVGYRMAVTVEKRFGRERLIRCMLDPRLLLRDYNAAVSESDAGGMDRQARWSPGLLKAIGLAPETH